MSYKSTGKAQVLSPEEGYDVFASHYDERRDYLDSFEKDEVKRMLGNVKGKKILDIGCGTGRLMRYLIDSGAEVVAADLSAAMLAKAQKNFRGVKTVKADIRDLPFEDESFDIVIAAFVIVHLKKLDKAFDEVYRVTKNGGHFLVTNINQRKSPKLKTRDREIVIESHYHIPKHVVDAMEEAFFDPEEEFFVEENGTWVNQILRGRKA